MFTSITTKDDLYEYKISICTDGFACGDCSKGGYCQVSRSYVFTANVRFLMVASIGKAALVSGRA